MSTTRLQFDVPESTIKLIDGAMAETDITTRKQFLEYALANLMWSLDQIRDGRVIAGYNEEANTFRQLIMPPFDGLRRKREEVRRLEDQRRSSISNAQEHAAA